MIPEITSIQEQLLLGDEAEKEAALELFVQNESEKVITYFIQKYNYTEQQARTLFQECRHVLFHHFLWNISIKETRHPRTKVETEIKRYFYYHFLQITQGINQPEEWNIMNTFIEIAANDGNKPLFLIEELLKMNESCQLLKGDKELKDKVFSKIFEKNKSVILKILRKFNDTLSKEDLEEIRNDIFFMLFKKLYPLATQNKNIRQLCFYISQRIHKNLDSCKNFNFIAFILKWCKFEISNRYRKVKYYTTNYDMEQEEEVISNNMQLKPQEEPISYSFSHQKEKRKKIFEELLKIEAEKNMLSNEKEEEGSFLTSLKNMFFASNKEKDKKLELESAQKEQKRLSLMQAYLSSCEVDNLDKFMTNILYEDLNERNKEIFSNYIFRNEGKNKTKKETKKQREEERETVEDIAQEFSTTTQNIHNINNKFMSDFKAFKSNISIFLLNTEVIPSSKVKKKDDFLRLTRSLIEEYNNHENKPNKYTLLDYYNLIE